MARTGGYGSPLEAAGASVTVAEGTYIWRSYATNLAKEGKDGEKSDDEEMHDDVNEKVAFVLRLHTL
ncbi:hypothetical protein BPAE_0183g00100 [Botrytis paeoniae]|uniref:Uncharacterized protein n=1 Tax=Botrytis paeoniae TaxID=278948 RepID=A0A4Z1FK79_9HELO|nr:hypothetical protein BPAE_0183g00100 [Botrytis paeoniae]